jgi:uncharacterized protein YhaN
MRLRQLDLTRYGKFSDHSLDFGPAIEGRADFHIVYGPNEAGKSTALSAYMDLLFGIGTQSSYGFLHDYKSMLIGATLESDGETLALTRTKGNKDTLRDKNGAIIDPARLSALLRGLDRDAYGAMFSLDGARLESGGEDILASKGELGRLLFSAASGMADIGGTLTALKGEAATFFAPNKRKHELNDLKDQLKTLDETRKNLDTHAADFDRLRETLAAAQTRRDAVQAERKRLTVEKDRLGRLKAAFPVAQDLTELTEQAAALADYPPLDDPSLLDEIAALREARTEARTMEQAASEEITRIDTALADQQPDTEALALADPLAQLQDLRSRYHTGRDDLEKRMQERDAASAAITASVAALGAPLGTDAETLTQPVDKLAQLSALIKEHTVLTAALATATREQEAAAEALSALQKSPDAANAPNVDTDTLAPLIKRIRNDDPNGTLERAEDALTRAAEDATRALAPLAPWTGTVDTLLDSTAPSADQAAAWRDRARAIAEDRSALETRQAKDAEDLARLTATIASMTGTEGVISDAQATATRAERDAAWRTHRAALDTETADAFERALTADDTAQAARLAQSDRLAALRELEQNRAALEAGLAAAQTKADRLSEQAHALRTEMSAPLRSAGLPESFDVLALPAWLVNRDTARTIAARSAAARQDRDSAAKRAASLRADLHAALIEAGTNAQADWSFDRLLDAGDALIERAKSTAQTRSAHEKAKAEATANSEKRQAEATKAEAALTEWQTQWTDALAGTWLASRTPDQVEALLNPLRDLPAQITAREDVERRIAGMKRDIDSFEQALNTLNADAPDADGADAATRFAKLSERAAAAKLADAKTATLIAARDGFEQTKTTATAKHTALAERVTEIAARYPADLAINDVDALALALRQSAKHSDLREKIASQKSALTGLLEVASLDDAKAMLTETTLADVTAALLDIDGAYQQADADWNDAIIAHRDAESAIQAIGGDAAVARLEEERATLVLDISEKAAVCLRLTLGTMAAERALHLYRDRHRSAMMSRTADAFRTITGGMYDSLQTQPDGNAERLIAIRKDNGASVGVEGMSTATRHQLFFALRLAGYEDFCAKAGPLPLIADDILESFDEERAAEAFTQLRAIAGKGQAIYLTHHRHLCTIAKEICGDDVTLHDL